MRFCSVVQISIFSSERMDQSPAASEVSLGQHSAISSAATTESVSGPLHSSINLPASLINYYDPNLISHVTQWPAEQMELRVSWFDTDLEKSYMLLRSKEGG